MAANRPDAARALRSYVVTVRLTESFVVQVAAPSAREAEAKVRGGDFDEGAASNCGDRKWTSVKAKRDD